MPSPTRERISTGMTSASTKRRTCSLRRRNSCGSSKFMAVSAGASIALLPDVAHIDGADALSEAADHQRVDLEVAQRIAMIEEDSLHAEHRPHQRLDIARRLAAEGAEQRRGAQRGQ